MVRNMRSFSRRTVISSKRIWTHWRRRTEKQRFSKRNLLLLLQANWSLQLNALAYRSVPVYFFHVLFSFCSFPRDIKNQPSKRKNDSSQGSCCSCIIESNTLQETLCVGWMFHWASQRSEPTRWTVAFKKMVTRHDTYQRQVWVTSASNAS